MTSTQLVVIVAKTAEMLWLLKNPLSASRWAGEGESRSPAPSTSEKHSGSTVVVGRSWALRASLGRQTPAEGSLGEAPGEPPLGLSSCQEELETAEGSFTHSGWIFTWHHPVQS